MHIRYLSISLFIGCEKEEESEDTDQETVCLDCESSDSGVGGQEVEEEEVEAGQEVEEEEVEEEDCAGDQEQQVEGCVEECISDLSCSENQQQVEQRIGEKFARLKPTNINNMLNRG